LEARFVNTGETPPSPTYHVVALSVLTLAAGVGGMVVSFLFLASQNHLDVIAGAVGFVAGAILVAAGLLSLTVQRRSPSTSQAAIRITACLVGILPPAVAILAWPVLYFGLFVAGLLLIPLVLVLCAVWAWGTSGTVAQNLCALLGWNEVRATRGFVFVIQMLATLASWPIFIWFYRTLESLGYKVGWS
jgi:hypothetical protein